VVVDLSEQTGGNAWPPLAAMHPLFGDANKANWVDRDGRRKPVVDRTALEKMSREPGDGRANPLARFGNGPLAVVSDRRTASAGEMLLVALLGEPRVQTFGNTSAGKTTGNVTYTLADGSTLILTQTRYALGDGPVYRGGIAPMHPLDPGESLKDAVNAAAQWAAENSPGCGAADPVPSSHRQREKT
jgi:C-terminal processing protease CtpA/Prc